MNLFGQTTYEKEISTEIKKVTMETVFNVNFARSCLIVIPRPLVEEGEFRLFFIIERSFDWYESMINVVISDVITCGRSD